MQKLPNYIAITLFSVCYAYTQNSDQYFYKNIASQSFTKQNSYFLNPTFTSFNSSSTAISILVKNSFIDFQNSPKFNLIGFSGKINEKFGAGIGLFQQSIGVFSSFGAVANYSQKLQITENSNLYFGFNFIINRNTLDRSKIQGNESDPAIVNFVDTNILAFQPALSYQINRFNFGMFIKDLLDYDVNSGEILTLFSEKTIAIHAMCTLPLSFKNRLFESSVTQFILTTNNTVDSKFTFSTLLDLPNAGWIQGSYDYLYGVGVGLGVNISNKISINYIYEQGKNALGSSNEVGITYRFDSKPQQNDVLIYNTKPTKTVARKPRNNVNTNKSTISVIKNDTVIKPVVGKIDVKDIETDLTDLELDNPKELDIKIRTLNADSSIEPGFYLVTNVFSKVSNAEKFIKKLEEENYEPNYFIHPETRFRYVYIAKTKTKDEMMRLYRSDNFRRYVQDKWILHVKN